jgi:plastocyanin
LIIKLHAVKKILLLILLDSSILITIFSSAGLLSSSTSYISDSSMFLNKAFAQESVFIAPGAADQSNLEPFAPSQLSIPIGTTVSWRNDDSTEHTVTANDRSFHSGPISPGDTFDNIFDSPGEFAYHCSIHPFMKGVVIVE